MDDRSDRDVAIALLIIRLSAAFFLAIWALDKLLGPGAALKTFSKYYLALDSNSAIMIFGALQIALVLAFALGAFRFWTYGAVVLMHAVSTFASWERYMEPWARPNILFWAAVPVLGGLIALFLLRHRDRFLSWDAMRS